MSKMCESNDKYKFTDADIDDILDNYCVPVWEANDITEMARNGYVLACVLEFLSRQKSRNFNQSEQPKNHEMSK